LSQKHCAMEKRKTTQFRMKKWSDKESLNFLLLIGTLWFALRFRFVHFRFQNFFYLDIGMLLFFLINFHRSFFTFALLRTFSSCHAIQSTGIDQEDLHHKLEQKE
jgi:hypothetical protein